MEDPFIQEKIKFYYIHPFTPLAFGDYKKKENFPNCCPHHIMAFKLAQKMVEEFPDCCDYHKQMKENPFVNIDFYKTNKFLESILTRISYAEHHIIKNINDSDWYKDITEYIEYISESFGDPNVGNRAYMWAVIDYIESMENENIIEPNKAQRLIDYINGLFSKSPGENQAEEIDFNELYRIYQKWLSVFPFTVQPFDKLKEKLTDTFPISDQKPIFNRYTLKSKVRVFTKGKLVEWLIERTNTELKAVDSKEMRENGLITDINKHRLDLLNERHKAKQIELLNAFRKDEKQYIKIIKEWLKHEKQYFKEYTTIHTIVVTPPQPIDKLANKFNPSMPLDEVRKWFIQPAIRKNKKDHPILTDDQVEQFIEYVFVRHEPLAVKLVANHGNDGFWNFVRLFYEFYDYCISWYGSKRPYDNTPNRDNYIKLLTDNFEGFTFEKVKANFAKKTGESWIPK